MIHHPSQRRWLVILAWAGMAMGICFTGLARDPDELQKQSTWSIPSLEQAQQQLEGWLTEIKADDATRKKAMEAWNQPEPGSDALVLDRVVKALSAVNKQAADLAEAMKAQSLVGEELQRFLSDEGTSAFLRNNLRLAYGRSLAQGSHFDEALEQLSGLSPDQVADPAALLFYQAVAYHRLLKKDECLTALDKLLENESRLPKRYVTIAKLMDADIRPLETDSLDEVARMMSDIRRRLNFGHAGKRVRKQEEDVIAKLDKMIKDIEDQLKKMPGGGQGQGGAQSSKPAEESQNLGGKGPGDVDQKRIGSKSGWGNLPPKEREQALQQISKDLPAHYREAIEEYFRKLSRDGGK